MTKEIPQEARQRATEGSSGQGRWGGLPATSVSDGVATGRFSELYNLCAPTTLGELRN